AHEKGFKALVTSLGAAALAMTRDYKPDAITLDICLPDIDGWRVLERLKSDASTRHIPVYVISTEEALERGSRLGARGVLAKPIQNRETLEQTLDQIKQFVGRSMKALLVVTPDPAKGARIGEIIGNGDIHTTTVTSGQEALTLLQKQRTDCLVLDSQLPDMTPVALAAEMQREPGLAECAVIVYGEHDARGEDEYRLNPLAENRNVRYAHSPERLLDQVLACVHYPVSKLPEPKRALL